MDISAETDNRRQIFRVSLAAAGIPIQINDLATCHLLDAHSEGFGATVPREGRSLRVGKVVQVRLAYGDQVWCGRATVRVIMRRENGTFRCGFAVLPNEQTLRRGLRQVAIAVQRQRLTRVANRR